MYVGTGSVCQGVCGLGSVETGEILSDLSGAKKEGRFGVESRWVSWRIGVLTTRR